MITNIIVSYNGIDMKEGLRKSATLPMFSSVYRLLTVRGDADKEVILQVPLWFCRP